MCLYPPSCREASGARESDICVPGPEGEGTRQLETSAVCLQYMPQVMHDSALAVRRPGECTFFTPGCEVSVDKVEFTPEMVRVREFEPDANRPPSH